MSDSIRWHLKLVTPPENDPVTYEEAMSHLRVTDMERYVAGLIKSATAHIDGKDGWLGRALITQTWELVMSGFPCNRITGEERITLPLPPLQEIVSISYVDANGDTQTLTEEADFTVIESEPAVIVPAYDKNFPDTRSQPDAVTIRFTAGYGDSPSDVPQPIKHGLLVLISDLYENREGSVIGAPVFPLKTSDNLLMPYRMSWYPSL